MLSVRCPVLFVCLSVTFVHCGQTVERIKTKLGMHVGLGPSHIVLDGDPQFSAHICCGQIAAWIKMSLGIELGLGPGAFVLDGDPAPPYPNGGGAEPPKFSAHVYWNQTAGWMKLVLGMEVGLSPIEFVLDGDPALPSSKRRHSPSPIFGPFLLWPNGCMHQDATWCGGRPQPRVLCIRWGPSPLKFSAHVYYSYCDFVRTLHNRYWFAEVQV